MTLTLHYHPLASFCHKALIALDELGLGFEPVVVDLFDPDSRAAFARVWPLLKVPVLEDGARGATVGESTAIIEYVDAFRARGDGGGMIPADPDLAWRARMWDRIFDSYVHVPMQKIVTDAIRPEGGHDPQGVAEARAGLAEAYRFLEAELPASPWALGADFCLADCAAAPALFYADVVQPLGPGEPRLKAYLDRLVRRPSYNRVLVAAAPFVPMFPLDPKPRLPA
jgi:glutathione S-transferase